MLKIGKILNVFHLKTSYPEEINDCDIDNEDEMLEFIASCAEIVLLFERHSAKEKIKTIKTLVDGLPTEINPQGTDLIEKQEVIGILKEYTLQDSKEEKVIQRIKEFFENKKQKDLRKE